LVDEASGGYFAAMRAIGLKALKNKLSEYVRLAAGGETILIADRDRVVAELVPPRATRAPSAADALLAEAVRKGLVTPPSLPPGPPPETRPVAKLREVLEELDRDRTDR
jgi:antitoxin (DNA-binding transcriptional repressor) of toxin-antitoxin stability system